MHRLRAIANQLVLATSLRHVFASASLAAANVSSSCASGALRLPLRATSPAPLRVAAPKGYHMYTLVDRHPISPDTSILKFQLPPSMPTLGATLPSCVKVKQTVTAPDGVSAVLDKSYSPVSYPDDEGFFELLVKAYPPRPADHAALHGPPGGLAAWLNSLEVGSQASMDVKADRLFHEAPYVANRWRKIGFVAGGTGVAPMVQLIRTILSDPADETQLSLVFANRHEHDILLHDEVDAYAAANPERFRVHYVLSKPSEGWTGGRGWVSAEDVGPDRLFAPSDDGVMIMVCGRDEFLDTVSGQTTRGPPPPGKKQGPKIQGDLSGVLKAAGFVESQVYKF